MAKNKKSYQYSKPSNLHLGSLLETKLKANTFNVMSAAAFCYKASPALAQYLLILVSRRQGRIQKKIERGPNFATFNVTSFAYNGILPYVNYARRYYKNCCTKLGKCECDFTDLM